MPHLCPLASAALAIAAPSLLAGCGGPPLQTMLQSTERLTYAGACAEASKKQSDALVAGEYIPARLFVHTWPKATAPADMFVAEARMAGALHEGEIRRVFLTARGGLGKTSLAESLRGQLCGTIPVFFLDLKEVAQAGDKPGDDAVERALARQIGAAGNADLDKEFRNNLAGDRYVLFADSIEEVDLVRRPGTLKALLAFGERNPNGAIVLAARPPVLDDDYGFAADTKLEIPPLECKVSDEFAVRQLKDEDEREAFKALLQRYGLNEKSRFGVQCVYPYLSTYRDVKTLVDFFRRAKGGDVLTSSSSVYEALIAQRLKKEFDNLRWTAADALDMGDRLLRVAAAAGGHATLRFDMAVCEKAIDPRWGEAAVDAGVAGSPTERKRHVCEKTYQSALFQRAEGSGSYVLADRATQDFFLARQINGEIARSPGQDCGTVEKHTDALNNQNILRFLVGQPFGGRCLAHIVANRCAHQPDAAADWTATIELGVVIGKARALVVQEARAAGSSLQPKVCIDRALADLERTIAE